MNYKNITSTLECMLSQHFLHKPPSQTKQDVKASFFSHFTQTKVYFDKVSVSWEDTDFFTDVRCHEGSILSYYFHVK